MTNPDPADPEFFFLLHFSHLLRFKAARAELERPQHEVRIAYRLAVGRYPVTFEEYDHFAEAEGREKTKAGAAAGDQ